MRRVRVATYNVLSSALCDAAGTYGFARCNAVDLDGERRFARLERKLAAQMELGAVLALQEISREWLARLLPFWEARGYAHAASLSGSARTGHMGQCTAWPRERFELRDVELPRIGAKMAGYREEVHAASGSWKEALSRHNCATMVRLRPRDDPAERDLCFANYHMPCAFGSDERCQVVVAHAALLVQFAQRWAGRDALVVLGDFNFDPRSAAYDLVVRGAIGAEHAQRPPPAPWAPDWDPTVQPMRSAYVEALGREPEFTNFAHTGDVGVAPSEPFCETLDYIFLSPQWSVADVEALPSKASLVTDRLASYPSADEPSDHLLLSAELALA
jgi:endonuclease/exonuclease/phosphatase family metal-dependent hydrolase